jgi:hypothetical protein
MTPAPICAATFVKEKDLPDGKKLFCCSRCKETHYASRGDQTAHWKFHKFTCVAIEKDDPRTRTTISSTKECFEIIHWCLDKPLERINGRLLLWAFRCLKWWCENRPNDFAGEDGGALMLSLDAKFRQMLDRYGHRVFQIIFAIPGFVNFFLSDELFLTKAVKELKKKGLPAPKPQIWLPGNQFKVDPKTALDPSMVMDSIWCRIVVCFFTFSFRETFEVTPESSDAASSFREIFCLYRAQDTALAAAVIRHAMTLWHCRYTSACLSAAGRNGILILFFGSAAATKFDAVKDKKPIPKSWRMKPSELVPGLTVSDLIEILHWENGNFFNHIPDAHLWGFVSALIEVDGHNQDSGPWKLIRPADRIRLIDMINEIDFPKNKNLRFPPGFDDIDDVFTYLLTENHSTKTLLEMHASVKHEDFGRGAAGHVKMNYDTIMSETKPNVAWRLKIATECLRNNGYDGPSLPDELLIHITEYLLPERLNGWFSMKIRDSSGQLMNFQSAISQIQKAAKESDRMGFN